MSKKMEKADPKYINRFHIRCYNCDMDKMALIGSDTPLPKAHIRKQKRFSREELKDHCDKPKLRITYALYERT